MNRRTFVRQLASAAPFLLARPGGGKTGGLDLSQLTSSTASLSGLSFEEALRQIRELGFAGVEILTFTGQKHSIGPIPGVVVADLTKSEKQRLRSMAGQFQHVSTHLPFHGIRLVAADPGVRKAALDRVHQAIDDSAFWGATVAVLHVSLESGKTYEDLRPDLLSVFRELGDHAARRHLRLGVETGAPNTVQEYLGFLRELGHDHVGGTVDTGHTRAYRADIQVADADRGTEQGAKRYNDVMMQKVEGLGPKLFHFHVDDVRPSDWREHRTLGTGLVDWQRLLSYLARTGYKGMFAIELEEAPPVEHLRRSREAFAGWLRKLS